MACIYLQRDLVVRSITAFQKCLKSAHSVSSQARQLKEHDVELLDPIISVCPTTPTLSIGLTFVVVGMLVYGWQALYSAYYDQRQ